MDEQGDQIFRPNGTRPLSITNSDNRVIAKAHPLGLEPIVAPGIAKEHRGFIQGRSMLANAVDIEHAASAACLQQEDAAIVFFDFTAAFPSVSRRSMLAAARS